MTIAAIRHNNPGNVSLPMAGWHGGGTKVGIRGQPGYAHFPDMQTGYEALLHRLATYIARGYNTIARLNSIYAQDKLWGRGVSKNSGFSLNKLMEADNYPMMLTLSRAIVKQETGKTLEQLGIHIEKA